jgi:glucan-binding YG repeat protein
MLVSGWAKDSKGYCWIGSDGYMPTTTQWIKYEGQWYHITNGYRDESKWMKDSKGWCWLQADGSMLVSGWAKDSIGWCWIGEAGYMIEKDMWIGEEGAIGSSYIIKGYRVDNKTITIEGVKYTFDKDGKLVG